MTASVLKQDPNTKKVQINAYLFEHGQTVRKFSGKSPLSSHKTTLKGQVQGQGWFLTRFLLKLAENDDVGETDLRVINAWKKGIFCHT